MIRAEWLDQHVEDAAAAESHAEENVGRRGRVVRKELRMIGCQPLVDALGKILLDTAATDETTGAAILTDQGPGAGATIRRSPRADHRDQHSPLSCGHQLLHFGDDAV